MRSRLVYNSITIGSQTVDGSVTAEIVIETENKSGHGLCSIHLKSKLLEQALPRVQDPTRRTRGRPSQVTQLARHPAGQSADSGGQPAGDSTEESAFLLAWLSGRSGRLLAGGHVHLACGLGHAGLAEGAAQPGGAHAGGGAVGGDGGLDDGVVEVVQARDLVEVDGARLRCLRDGGRLLRLGRFGT